MEVGEERQALAHPVVLLGDRLLDLEHHVGLGPDVVGRVDDRGPAATYLSSVIDDPRPAPFWTTASWSLATSTYTFGTPTFTRILPCTRPDLVVEGLLRPVTLSLGAVPPRAG